MTGIFVMTMAALCSIAVCGMLWEYFNPKVEDSEAVSRRRILREIADIELHRPQNIIRNADAEYTYNKEKDQ